VFLLITPASPYSTTVTPATMSFRPVSGSLSTAVQMSLDSWVFRSDAAFPVDLMILTKSANQCDSLLTNQTSSRLMSLPLELVAIIGDFLGPADRVCFTLSCKRAACGVGIKCWGLLGRATASTSDRWMLLQTLKRDLPGHHLCFYSGKLCKLSSGAPSGECRRRRRPREPELSVAAIEETQPPQFGLSPRAGSSSPFPATDNDSPINRPSFCDLQLLVEKQLHRSPYEFTAIDFNFSRPWNNSYQLRSTTPRFWRLFGNLESVGNELRLYTAQHCIVGYNPKDTNLMSNPLYRKENWYDFGMPICRHPRRYGCKDIGLEPTQTAMTRIFKEEETYWQSASYTCPMCPKYFRFTAFKHADHNALELVIQSVQIFGPKSGLSELNWNEVAKDWKTYCPHDLFTVPPHWPSGRSTRPTRDTTLSDLYISTAPEEQERYFTDDHVVVSAFDDEVQQKLYNQRRDRMANSNVDVKDRVDDRAGASWMKWHLVTAPKIAYRKRRERNVKQGGAVWSWT
jgi:hypothetical protein